jgi:hypothetical protein
MAKLMIPPRTGVQMLQSPSPSTELNRGRMIQGGLEDIAGTARGAMNYFQQLEQDEASTNMSLEYSQTYNDMVSEQYINTDRAIELGAQDSPNLYDEDDDGNVVPREEIPIWEVLPEIAKRKYDKLTEKYARKISGSGHRQEWVNRRKLAGQQMYDDMLANQRQAFFDQKVANTDAAMVAAQESQDYGLMVALAGSYPIVEKREELVKKAREVAEIDSYHRAIQAGDPNTMIQLADWIKNPNNPSVLSEEKQTAWMNTLLNTAKSFINEDQNKILEQADQLRVMYEAQIAADDPSAAVTLGNIQDFLQEAGDPHYFGKAWYAGEVGRLVGKQMEWQQKQSTIAAFMSASNGGYSLIDVTDDKTKDTIDEFAERRIGEAYQTGGDVAAHDTMVQIVRQSAASGYLPRFFKTQLNMLNSPVITPQHARTVTGIYDAIISSNQMLLHGVDEKTVMMAASLHKMSVAGVDMMEGFKQLQANMRGKTMEEQRTLRDEVTKYMNEANSPNTGMLESKIRTSKGIPGVPAIVEKLFSDLDSNAGVSSTMRNAYDSLVEEYYVMNGGDLEVAQDAAFTRLINTWQVSNVNGKKQFMRDAPEFRYGQPAELITEDFHSWLKELSPDINPEELHNYFIQPDIATSQERKPGYSVFKIGATGMPIPVTANGGMTNLRYRPRVKQMVESNAQRKILEAKREREWQRALDENRTAIKPEHMLSPEEQSVITGERERVEGEIRAAGEPQREQESRIRIIEERSGQQAQDRELLEGMGMIE